MNELAEIFDEFFAVDLFDDFFEESEDHELHGDTLGYAALHHIEEFFFISCLRATRCSSITVPR